MGDTYYLLIMKAVLHREPGAQPSLTERYFGEQAQCPDELREWMESKNINPWPVYAKIDTYHSMRAHGTYYLPAIINTPTAIALHGCDANEVADFRARWPEWFVEALPYIPEERAVQLWFNVQDVT